MDLSPKVLICKPSSLGDIIHALPLLRHLKVFLPRASVYWWVNSSFAPLLEGDPDLDGVFLFDKKAWKSLRNLPRNLSLLVTIRRMHFDYTLDLQALARSAIFSWFFRARKTIGLDDRREWAPIFYNYAVPRPSPQAHAVDWYLEALRPMGIPLASHIEWLPENPVASQSLIKRFPFLTHSPLKRILIQPRTRWQSKEWPLEYFIDCAQKLLVQRDDVELSVMGSSADLRVGEAILKATNPQRVRNLCGRLSLPEMVEWIRRGDLMLTNDTGPMHVAAALRKPMVALFGATDPLRTGPYGQLDSVLKADWPCSPCLKRRCPLNPSPQCMFALTPERVVGEILKKL